jgi:hypothetical protein
VSRVVVVERVTVVGFPASRGRNGTAGRVGETLEEENIKCSLILLLVVDHQATT